MDEMGASRTVRLLVCDVDGTLVRDDKSLSRATVAAVERLHAAGIAMSLISARPISGLRPIADALGIDEPCAAFNGGTLFNHDGIVSKPARLEPETALRVLSVFDAAGIEAWIFSNDRWYAPNAHNPHVPRERLSSDLAPTLRTDLRALCHQVDKIIGVHDDLALLARIETALREALRTEATVALSQSYFLDITASAANKGDGVHAVATVMGCDLAEVAVIGDMPNDLPMFERAGLSIAMGQSPEVVRLAADWVTESNENDGVAKAIDRLIASNLRLAGRKRALMQWENEGGALPKRPQAKGSTAGSTPDAPPLGNTELVQLQIRVIALESLVVALLAAPSDDAIALAREMAAFITPRPGHTPHRLTLHAAREIHSLIRRARRLRTRSD